MDKLKLQFLDQISYYYELYEDILLLNTGIYRPNGGKTAESLTLAKDKLELQYLKFFIYPILR